MRTLALSALLAASIFAGAASAQAPAANPAWKIPEVVAFTGVRPGDRVADVVGGRLTGAFAKAVGPTGKVYAIETAEVVKVHPEVLKMMDGLKAAMPYVVVTADPVSAPLPEKLDVVFIRQNYHDLYDKFMGPADVPAFNRAVFKALKPGGAYVILDHAAKPGSGVAAAEGLHRIDVARVKADAAAAGFRLEAQSPILENGADDHSKNVFDPSVRDHTDQFLLRFRKPK